MILQYIGFWSTYIYTYICVYKVYRYSFSTSFSREGNLWNNTCHILCFHHVNPCTGWEDIICHVSQRGLAEVLHEIQIHGLPSATSRSSVKRARDADIEACANTYGKVLLSRELETEGKGNSKQTFPFVHPLAFVQHCLTECQPFRDYFIKYILPFGQDPSSPIEKLELVWL